MEISPVAVFRSPLPEKFGIPRQAGLVPQLVGTVELREEYRGSDVLRGLEGFDYMWLVWGFDKSGHNGTVRPPRLGGNARIGVFASRSPFRPNPIGLSSVKILGVDAETGKIEVSGADLKDGSQIYDIKPYVAYTDSHPDAAGGFVDAVGWQELEVSVPAGLASVFSEGELKALEGVLAQDPRPRYQDDPERIYGMTFSGRNVKFRVEGNVLTIIKAE